ncbi:MAG: galactose oxidase early set domain-containing protein [Paraperlucidibaca sp.]
MKNITKNKLVPLFLVGTSLVLAACGGSSSSGDSNGGSNGGSASARETGRANISEPDCSTEDCAQVGGFTTPFVEPFGPTTMKTMAQEAANEEATDANSDMLSGLLDSMGLLTSKGNLKNPVKMVPQDDRCLRNADGRPTECKPTAGSIALLEDNRVLYFNALEGTEDTEFSIFFEAGAVVTNDQTRVMSLRGRRAGWMQPSPVDGGANPDGANSTVLLPGGLTDTSSKRSNNDGALFCADLEMLADGRIMAVGGTDYYFEPGLDGPIALGVSELEGIKNARIFNPANNRWSKTGDMKNGRWYPSLTTLANGNILVTSGVTKLIKPIYPENPLTSGRNVTESETYDFSCGTWSSNGGGGERSLPLYPRQHLLPNGQVLYNAAGQAFNPFGQSYDQALWNIVAAYSPDTHKWTDLGYAGLPLRLNKIGLERIGSALNVTNPDAAADIQSTLTGLLGSLMEDPVAALSPLTDALSGDPSGTLMNTIGAGFRGSTFSIQMPLKANDQGRYDHAEFLTGGGVLGLITVDSPGSYFPTDLSRIDRINIAADDSMQYESRATGNMTVPRWYGTGVLLPTGNVMVFSGADRDEVVLPGLGGPIMKSEMFDPATETWTAMATAHNPRTYHNTAMLLPDGRILIGGHSPINTAYAFSINIPGLSPNDGRDPSFEIYSPPYVFGPRPSITSAPSRATHGDNLSIGVANADKVVDVVLVKRTTLTHIVDGDQRTVSLPFTRSGKTLTARMPTQKAVTPAGAYMVFVITENAKGERIPSESTSLRVTSPETTNPVCKAQPAVAQR